MGCGGKGKGFSLGATGTREFGLAGEFSQFWEIGQLTRGEEAGVFLKGQFASKCGIIHEENGLIFPAFRVQPDGKGELAATDLTHLRNRYGGATADRGGDFLCEREKGFDPASVLNGQGIKLGVIFCQLSGFLGKGRQPGQGEGEE